MTKTPPSAFRPRRAQPTPRRGRLRSRLYLEHLENRTLLAAPVAVDDLFVLDEDATLSESAPGVLANDTDDDGDSLIAVLVNGPVHGSLVLNPDGSFDYTPSSGFHGTDAFTYLANDGGEDSGVATVTLMVNPINGAPTATDDAYSVVEDASLTVTGVGVLANDTDPDGDALTAWVVEGPYAGMAALDPSGAFIYTPSPDFYGEDYIFYRVNDGELDSDMVVARITVHNAADAPRADDDYYSVRQDEVLTGASPTVLANDSDVDGDALSAILVAGPEHGSLAFNDDGSFTYTPNPGFAGGDSFTYLANDGAFDSNVATVYLDVTAVAVNGAPVANPDEFAVAEDGTLSVGAFSILNNDSDPEGDPLSAELLQGPAHGSLDFRADGSFTYTPNGNYAGRDFFVYAAKDGSASSEPALVSILVNAVNDVPGAANDVFQVEANGTLTIAAPGVLANDVDPEGTALHAQIVNVPSNGTLVFNVDGSFTYAPHAGFSGTDTFTYTASDGVDSSPSAKVTIQVIAAPAGNDGAQPPSGETVLSGEARFIHGLYQDLLNRPPDDAGLNAWLEFLRAGNGRDLAARAFWRTAEHRARQVDQWYAALLHRSADESGRTLWVNALLAGAAELDIMQGFVLSGEYQASHGSTTAFITGLYQDALGREPDSAGLSAWLLALQSGATRAAAARTFFTSSEGYGHVVDQLYVEFLDRAAAAGEEAGWASLLQNGRASLEDVAVLILSSPEYYGAT